MDEDAEDYWNFSFHEMAFDVQANVEAMYLSAGGVNKGYYFGAQQGALQMNVALVLDQDRLTSKLNRVVELEPCTVKGIDETEKLEKWHFKRIGQYQDLGIYGYPTAPEDWADDQERVCDNLNKWNCRLVSELDADYPIKKSSKNDDHWVQMENTRRFQRFVEDWSFDPLIYTAEEYDLKSITEMPISLIVGSEDKYCPLSRAEWLADQVSNVQNFYVIENAGRVWPYDNGSAQYIELLMNEVYSQDLLPEMN